MKSLVIENLRVSREGKEIVKGVSLTVRPGEVHALMGPNGSGKSSLANALMGHPKYAVTGGRIILDGRDITAAAPDARSRAGLFLSMQYPPEIAGVTVSNFLRTAVNARRAKPLGVIEFYRLLKEKMAELKIDSVFGSRGLNEGFSGGEKKRLEILQLSMLAAEYAILDETDSGLDVDALKI
ncbi:MAG: Fe-S cluster assembly ATPase SufC, partial [Patescibacteria group bacterium]